MHMGSVFHAAFKKSQTPHTLIALLEKAVNSKCMPRDWTVDQIQLAKLCYLLGKKKMVYAAHQAGVIPGLSYLKSLLAKGIWF